MLSNLQTWSLIGITGVVWLTLGVVGTLEGGPQALLVISDTLPFLMIGASVFERWLWRWQRLHPHLVGTPMIGGTWKGELESLWKDPKTKRTPATKVAYLAITQTLTTVSVRLFTNESASAQMVGTVAKQSSGTWALSYQYANTPLISLRPKSPPHLGSALLDILGEPPVRIEGEYYTDRDSKGMIRMRAHVAAVTQSFQDAEALFRTGGTNEVGTGSAAE